MRLFSVTAQVAYSTSDGWHGSVQIPAFLLSDHQVRNEVEAEALARMIVDPLRQAREVFVTVVELGVAHVTQDSAHNPL